MEGGHPSSPIFERLATAIEHPVNWNEVAKMKRPATAYRGTIPGKIGYFAAAK
jgi:hypothetical protein